MLSGYIYYWQVYIGVQKIDSPAAQLFLAGIIESFIHRLEGFVIEGIEIEGIGVIEIDIEEFVIKVLTKKRD